MEERKLPERIPTGLALFAHEFCAIWKVELNGRETLVYPDVKCPVPKSAEIIVEHEPNFYLEASKFAILLRDAGWSTVTVQPRHHVVFASGCEA